MLQRKPLARYVEYVGVWCSGWVPAGGPDGEAGGLRKQQVVAVHWLVLTVYRPSPTQQQPVTGAPVLTEYLGSV